MIHPGTDRLRILASAVADPRALAALVAEPRWQSQATEYKRSDRTSVVTGQAPLDPARPSRLASVVVKSLVLRGSRDLISESLHRSRGWRQWQGAELLHRRGFDAARPLLLFRARSGSPHDPAPQRWVETIVLEHQDGRTLLEHIARPSVPCADQHAIADAVGRFTRRLADQWLLNRDHKPSNIVLVPLPAGGWRPTLIDTVGVRSAIGSPLRAVLSPGPPIPHPGAERRAHEALLCRMLATLLIEPIGVGRPARRALRWRALRASLEPPAPPRAAPAPDASTLRSLARARWRRVEAIVVRHADPVPHDDPLAGAV